MPRRVHVPHIRPGNNPLAPTQAHHLRDVLRLTVDSTVDLFDDAGSTATAVIIKIDAASVVVRVDQIDHHQSDQTVTLAVAVPKGERADWMVEKLSELGVWRFVPLTTDRGVVRPGGINKLDRWKRLAIESAKQSRRPGIMKIEPLISMQEALALADTCWYCSTATGTTPIASTLKAHPPPPGLWIFVGPEGGWSDGELKQFQQANATPVGLTQTILRVETAAIAVVAVIACGK
jgi:16S rRNA (uracil1498-N3)-methyltransferase